MAVRESGKDAEGCTQPLTMMPSEILGPVCQIALDILVCEKNLYWSYHH
jgi:hypothetical protein